MNFDPYQPENWKKISIEQINEHKVHLLSCFSLISFYIALF